MHSGPAYQQLLGIAWHWQVTRRHRRSVTPTLALALALHRSLDLSQTHLAVRYGERREGQLRKRLQTRGGRERERGGVVDVLPVRRSICYAVIRHVVHCGERTAVMCVCHRVFSTFALPFGKRTSGDEQIGV